MYVHTHVAFMHEICVVHNSSSIDKVQEGPSSSAYVDMMCATLGKCPPDPPKKGEAVVVDGRRTDLRYVVWKKKDNKGKNKALLVLFLPLWPFYPSSPSSSVPSLSKQRDPHFSHPREKYRRRIKKKVFPGFICGNRKWDKLGEIIWRIPSSLVAFDVLFAEKIRQKKESGHLFFPTTTMWEEKSGKSGGAF